MESIVSGSVATKARQVNLLVLFISVNVKFYGIKVV